MAYGLHLRIFDLSGDMCPYGTHNRLHYHVLITLLLPSSADPLILRCTVVEALM